MQRNQKLTKVIAGRTIKAATTEPGGVLVLFDDQSTMKRRETFFDSQRNMLKVSPPAPRTIEPPTNIVLSQARTGFTAFLA
jgi:hypothetical protein